MFFSFQRCVYVCCGVLQCVAVYCSVVPCVAVWFRVLQCVAGCCSVVQYVAVWCSVLKNELMMHDVWCIMSCNTLHVATPPQYETFKDARRGFWGAYMPTVLSWAYPTEALLLGITCVHYVYCLLCIQIHLCTAEALLLDNIHIHIVLMVYYVFKYTYVSLKLCY